MYKTSPEWPLETASRGVKAVSRGSHATYPVADTAVNVSVPNAMKAFPAELLPQ